MVASPHTESGVWYDMTVAMGVLSESGDYFVATDSRVVNESAMTMTDGVLKSVRINDLCALAFCGDAAYANHVVASLFSLGEEAEKEPEGILQLVEEGPMALDTDPYGIAYYVRGIFSRYDAEVQKGNIVMPKVSAILVGQNGSRMSMWAWRWEMGWKECFWDDEKGQTQYAVLGPGTQSELSEAISSDSIPIWRRTMNVAERCRAACPCAVNLDISVRRASKCFQIEKLSDLLSNSSARDPSAAASHVDGDT